MSEHTGQLGPIQSIMAKCCCLKMSRRLIGCLLIGQVRDWLHAD
jgi:hypothetical protein